MGRIGKPQKSGKHKKIKAIDPFYVGNRVADKRAVGVNQRPKDVDEQELPFSLREMIKQKEKAKKVKRLPSRRQIKRERQAALKERKELEDKGMTRPLKPVPEFRQAKKESDEAYLNRIERETQIVIAKAQFEEKYKVDLDAPEGTSVKKKTKKSKKNRERLKEKKLKKKGKLMEKRENRKTGFEKLKDEVKFGEVAMEPPNLKAKPRKSTNIGELQPGKRKLLLNEILQQNSDVNSDNQQRIHSKQRQIGQTIKRKRLAPVQQYVMDQEREKAIQQYRQLKKQKLESPNS